VSGGYDSGRTRSRDRARDACRLPAAILFSNSSARSVAANHSNRPATAVSPTSIAASRLLRLQENPQPSRCLDEALHPEQGRHVEKFSAAMLLLNCVSVSVSASCCSPMAVRPAAMSQTVHIERVVTLSVSSFPKPSSAMERPRQHYFEGSATDLAAQSRRHGRASRSKPQRCSLQLRRCTALTGEVRQGQIDGENQLRDRNSVAG